MAKGDPTQPNQGMGYFPGLYQSALAQTAEDYDSIMNQYKDLSSRASSTPTEKLNYSPIAPSLANYIPGSDFSELRNFANTGGFSEADLGNIRARGIAPIRSIYSSAQQNLQRNRALQGGYDPSFGASSAKMAREASDIISKRSTDVNAGIAEMVQKGKLAGATSLAPLEARMNELQNQVMLSNTAATNRANEFNATMPLQYAANNRAEQSNDFDDILETIRGQQSLYGTTPALASTFGNQVLNAASLVNSFPPVAPLRTGSGPGGSSLKYGSLVGGRTRY